MFLARNAYVYAGAVEAELIPEPPADEREAILVALDPATDPSLGGAAGAWRQAAVREAVEREAVEHPHP